MWVAFANAKVTHIYFSKSINIYAIFNEQSFNDMLSNDTISSEQLGLVLTVNYTHTYMSAVQYSNNLLVQA